MKLLNYAFLAAFGIALAGCATGQRSDPSPSGEQQTRLSGSAHPEAEQAFEQAMLLWKRAPASVSVGESCSDPAKAVELLDKAVTLDPAYAAAYLRRGLAKSEMGQKEESFDDVTAAIRLKPSAEAYAYRALVSIRAGQPRAAQKDLAYALEKTPKHPLALNFSGVLALTMGNTTEACAQFKQGCSAGDCSFLESAKANSICP